MNQLLALCVIPNSIRENGEVDMTNDKIERDIAAVFVDGESLNDAVSAVLKTGIEKGKLSLLCAEDAVKQRLQADYSCVGELTDSGSMVRYVENEGTPSTVSSTIGGLSLAATAVGGGAIIASAGIFGGAVAVATAASVVVGGVGALAGAFISQTDADALQSELDAGHIVLLVRTGEDRMKDKVLAALDDCASMDARVLQAA